jgi:hypothetical protein
MKISYKRQEIDHRTIKLLIGLIAITLPFLTSFFAKNTITSISASYFEGGWAQSIFLGFLFAIAAFMLAYNGESVREMIPAKIAAVAALGVALFPCKCDIHTEIVPYVHGISAAIMFLILAWFCYVFYKRARGKGDLQANRRAFIYTVCGLLIVLVIGVLTFDHLLNGIISKQIPRLTFYGEGTGLIAFGVSWFTASHILPPLAQKDEQLIFFGR